MLAVLIAGCNSSVKTRQDQSKDFSIRIGTSSDNGIFSEGQLLQVYAKIRGNTKKETKGQVLWEIETDEQEPLKKTTLSVTVKGDKVKQAYCPVYDVPGPGFYRFTCTFTPDRGGKSISDSLVIGYDPEKVNTPVTREADFDKFWKKTLKELAGIEPEYNLILKSEKCTEKVNVYLVEMKSLGDLTVRGWLEVPKAKGKYPALLRVPGYTSAMKPTEMYDDVVVFSFNPRSHGESDDAPGAPLELWVRGLDSKDSYYYRGTYMDCIRAVDFLASRPKVDTKRIAVWGGSQGGGLSFMTAAMDKRISYCLADVPWLCDWKRYLETTNWEEIDDWLAADPARNWDSMFREMSYFDTMNMAERIKCPVLMGIGLQDKVCPPSTSFATYNKIKSPKEYRVYLRSGHDLDPKHWELGHKWLREHFGLQ